MSTLNILLIILYVLLGVIVCAAICFSMLLAAIVHGTLFGGRQDKNPKLKYFSLEDFNLSCENIELNTKNGRLRGIVCGEGKTTVVFCHGMGPGCAAYTTEITRLVSFGYRVVAVDYIGCGISEGQKPRGIRAGVDCAELAVEYARARFGGKVVLVGHSWGAYSALCATKAVKVEGVVAMSSPNSPAKMLADGAAPYLGGWVKILTPCFWSVNQNRGGNKNNLKAAKCIDKSGVPALIIHGADDNVVPLTNSAYAKAKGKNVQKFLVIGRGHNPYNTVSAQNLLNELSANLQKASGKTPDEQAEKFLQTVDYSAVCEEDEDVMLKIKDFIDKV